MVLNSTGNGTWLRLGVGTTLTGGGKIVLSDNSANQIFSIVNDTSATVTNLNNTIQGSGVIGYSNGMEFINKAGGTINATGTVASLVLQPGPNAILAAANGGGFVNQGLLESTGAGGLVLNGGQFNNLGGQISAIGTSIVGASTIGNNVYLQSNVTVSGGTLTASGGAVIETVSGQQAFLDATVPGGMTLNGTYLGTNNSTTNISGQFTNNGTVLINSTGNATWLRLGDGTTLTGGGQIVLSDNPNNAIFGILNNQLETVTNVDNTISGAGALGYSNRLEFINQKNGVINANGLNALYIEPSPNAVLATPLGGGFVNQGLLEATNSGGLYLYNGQFNNNGGTILAAGAGNNVHLQANAEVSGGLLISTGGGVIMTDSGQSAYLDGTSQGPITLSGTYVGQNNSTTFLNGTFNNTGLFLLNGAGNVTDLRLSDGTTLTGGGTLTLSDSPNNRVWGATNSGAETVTNVNNTIQGAGLLGYSNSFEFINQKNGIINANGLNALVVQPTTNPTLVAANGGGFVNQGLMLATNTGGLVLNGGQFNNATGTILAQGAGNNVYLQSNVAVSGGWLGSTGGGVVTTVSGQAAYLDGTSQGAITLAGTYIASNNSQTFLNGVINNTGQFIVAGAGNTTYLRIVDGTSLTGGGTVTLTGPSNTIWGNTNSGTEVLTNVDNTIQGSGTIGYSNSIGIVNSGTIKATDAAALVLNPSVNNALSAGIVNLAGGVLQGAGSGGLLITQGSVNNQGLVEALDGSAVTYGASVTNQNLSGGTLTGGIWRSISTGSGSSINLTGGPINTNAADIYLVGAGSSLIASGQSLDSTLSVNNGALRIQESRQFIATANGGNFQNNGLLEVTNGSGAALFQATTSLTNTASGIITGYGTVGNRVANAGTIDAIIGVLSVTGGVTGTGTLQAATGATMDLSAATAASTAGNLVLASGGNANLGTQNITISNDYNNANFGTGNSFARHANVAGAGLILASGTGDAMTLTGTAVSGGTLALGHVHVGAASTGNFAINWAGTNAPVLRGAVQTTGSLTAAAPGFGPLATGNAVADSVSITPNKAGALSGQSLTVVSNFDNVASQTLAVTGAAYDYASPGVAPNPVNIGNVHVGSVASQVLTISNNTITNATFQEGLDAAVSGAKGAVTGGVTTSGSITNLTAGTSSTAISVGINTATAGDKSGSATLLMTSNGTNSGLASTALAPQTVTVNGAAYDYAHAAVTATPIAFGNVHTGATVAQQAVTVANNTVTNAAYQEGLNASFGTTAAGLNNNGGSVTNLASGGSNNTAMKVGINTAVAGGINTTQQINLVSNGTKSGLADTALAAQSVTVTGGVYDLASPTVSPNPVAFGNVHVGATVSQVLTVTNNTITNASFQEGLDSSVTGTSGGVTSNGGSINNLGAGKGSTAIAVGINTTTAGDKSGSATLGMTSDGATTSLLGTTALAAKTVTVTGAAYDLAKASVSAAPIAFGNVHVGDSVALKGVTVANSTITNAAYQEGLNASFGTLGGGLTSNGGSISNLAAGSSDSTTMKVGISTATAGAINANAQIGLVSTGATTSGLGTTALTGQSVSVTAGVYNLASSNIIAPINIVAHVGDGGGSKSQALSITNTAPVGTFSEGLDSSFGGFTAGGGNTITPSLAGSITNLVAGATDNTSMKVTISTATAGIFNGTVTVNQASNGAGTSGLGITALTPQQVAATGSITVGTFNYAAPTVNNAQPIAFGNVRQGAVIGSQSISISNTAPVSAFTEALNGSVATSPTGFNASGSFSGLQAGASPNTSITVAMDTSTAGAKGGNVSLGFVSDGTGVAGDSTTTALSNQNVAVTGAVYRTASPTLNTPTVTLAARVGDSAPSAAISVTNISPDSFTEGLKANISALSAGFSNTGGAVSNLAAQGTDAGTLKVGMASTATSGTTTGNATVSFVSTGTGTDNAADLGVGSGTVALTSKVYQTAVASVTPSVTFGTVHVGDVVGPKAINVANTAGGALVDVITGSVTSVSGGPFTNGGGSLGAGVAAGGNSNALTVGLNTSTAGVYNSGSATLALASHNADLSDVALSTGPVGLSATVNNYASIGLANATKGALTGGGAAYTLNLGSVTQGGGIQSALIDLLNNAVGPADALSMAANGFSVQSGSGFTINIGAINGLLAGSASLADLFASFDTSTLGIETETIQLLGTGSNNSGWNSALGVIDPTLTLTVDIVSGDGGTQPVPEPASWIAMLAGLLGLGAVGRKWRLAR